MKQRKEPIVWNGILFDSQEEVYVAMWLEELKSAKIIKYWDRKVSSIQITTGLKIGYTKETQLKTKLKQEIKAYTLLRPSEYTPDFEIQFYGAFFGNIISPPYASPSFNKDALFFTSVYGFNGPVIIEVKPTFDQNNMERLFVLNQKFLWDKYRIFVNLVEPIELFKKTFLPSAAIPYFTYIRPPKGKKVGDYKFDWKPKTIQEFLNINN